MEKQAREKRLVAGTSVAAAVLLTSAKLVIGILTGSLGILAEAAHSGLDLAAAVITFFAVRVSDRPADETHMYGHGKVENLSALAETSLLFVTCIWIIYEAVHRLFFATIEVKPTFWAFLVMGMSIVIDFSRSRALGRIAKKYRSQALEADALHFSTDIWSSAVVILGLALVKYGEYRGTDKTAFEKSDAIAALIVAAIVIAVSYRLGRRAVDALLDRAPQGLADRLSRSVQGVTGIRRVRRTRVRDLGNRVFVDMTVDVPRHLSFEESHDLSEKAQQAVRTIAPDADVVVHAEPVSQDESVIEKVRSVAAREHVPIHNLSTHWTDKGVWIDLDLEVDSKLSFERAHEQATNLENRLRSELMGTAGGAAVAGINAHIEPRSSESAVVGAPLGISEADVYSERIHAIGRELEEAGGFHSIELHKIDGKVYLSFHMSLDVETPISRVHGLAEEMENRLRREFPDLGRVVIHTEPE